MDIRQLEVINGSLLIFYLNIRKLVFLKLWDASFRIPLIWRFDLICFAMLSFLFLLFIEVVHAYVIMLLVNILDIFVEYHQCCVW